MKQLKQLNNELNNSIFFYSTFENISENISLFQLTKTIDIQFETHSKQSNKYPQGK